MITFFNYKRKTQKIFKKIILIFLENFIYFFLLLSQIETQKMKNESFQIIITKIWKYRWKIITTEKIRELIEQTMWDSYTTNRMYKIFYYLKNRWYIIDLKKNFYYVKLPEDEINEEYIVDRLYRSILNKQIKSLAKWKRYIWGLKALEIAMGIYTTPDEILIVNENKQGIENLILEKKILFKTYSSKKKNLYAFFHKETQPITIEKEKITIALPELAILETLYNTSTIQKNYSEDLIKKWLRKNKKSFNINIIERCLKENKHNSSINRLAELAENVDHEIAKQLKTIIKKYWYLLN